MEPQERLRMFIALDLPAGLKEEIAVLQEALRSKAPKGVRWVRPEGVHLTLKFLGWVEEERTGTIEKVLRREASQEKAFDLRLTGLGCFPHRRSPRVIWVGVEEREDPQGESSEKKGKSSEGTERVPEKGGSSEGMGKGGRLSAFQQRLDAGLESVGFPREERPFFPHLTLGRVEGRLIPRILDLMMEEKIEGECFRLKEVHLMRSELKPGGSVYTRWLTAPFNG
jgi:2'-5' RNA ligase